MCRYENTSNHWCCFFDFYTHTLTRVIFCLNSCVPWCGDCAAASAWKSQLKPNMGCGWRTCVLGRRCEPTLPSPWWNGVVSPAWHQGFAPAWRRCASNISKMTILFSIHILWRKSPGICFTSMMSAQVKKNKTLRLSFLCTTQIHSFSVLPFNIFPWASCSVFCIWFVCDHAAMLNSKVSDSRLLESLGFWCLCLFGIPGSLGMNHPGSLVGYLKHFRWIPRNPSLEVRVPAAPLMSQRTFTVAWMRFASDCYGWWRTSDARKIRWFLFGEGCKTPDFWGFASKLVLTADQETSHLLKEATNNFVLSNATDEDREVKEPIKQKHRWFSELVLWAHQQFILGALHGICICLIHVYIYISI